MAHTPRPISYGEALSLNQRTSRGAKKKIDHLRIHRADNGGHLIEHHFESSSGPYQEPEQHVFAKDEGEKLMAHVAHHMGVEPSESAKEEAGESAAKEKRELRGGKN